MGGIFEFDGEEEGDAGGETVDPEEVRELHERLGAVEAAIAEEAEAERERDPARVDALLDDMSFASGEDKSISVNVADIGGSLLYRMTIPKEFAVDLDLDTNSQVLVRRVGDDGLLVRRV